MERELWDLPEDSANPEEVKRLEETGNLSWKVRILDERG